MFQAFFNILRMKIFKCCEGYKHFLQSLSNVLKNAIDNIFIQNFLIKIFFQKVFFRLKTLPKITIKRKSRQIS